MKVYCVYSRESPHQGDSNEFTQYTIFYIKKKITLAYLKSAAMETQERVRNSRGKRDISVRATEVLLCMFGPMQVTNYIIHSYQGWMNHKTAICVM